MSFQIRYVVKRLDIDDEWSEPIGSLRLRVRTYLASKRIGRAGGPGGMYQNHEVGTNYTGPDKKRSEAAASFVSRTKAGKVGEQWVLIGETGKFTARKVKANVKDPITDTSGNDRIDRIYTEVFTKWPNSQNWGICVCKRILGTNEYSQHSYCNALDTHNYTSVMYDISRWMVANADRLSIHTVIYNRQVWSRETPYWHYYSGDNPHTDHVHVDCDPQGTGWPYQSC